jgi:predicted nucleotidyltransferase
MRFNVSLLDFIHSRTQLKIVKFLLSHEAAMSEREIASIVKVSHMSVNRALQKLTDINFVNFIKIGKAHLWKVNRKSYAFKVLSELVTHISDISVPLKELKTVIMQNLPKSSVEKVILFGSVAKGEEKPNSDIDLFILIDGQNSKKPVETAIDKLSTICFERYGNRLSAYILTQKDLQKKQHLKIIVEINNGLQLFP